MSYSVPDEGKDIIINIENSNKGGNRMNVDYEKTSNKGMQNGYCPLDKNARVPAAYGPKQVDTSVKIAGTPEANKVWGTDNNGVQKWLDNTNTLIYTCNDINDNEILSQMSKDFFNDDNISNNANLTIVVKGNVGEDNLFKYGNGTENDPASDWELGTENYTGSKKLTFDFVDAVFKEANDIAISYTYMSRIKVTNNQITIKNCNFYFKINATDMSYGSGFFGCGHYMNCTSINRALSGSYGFSGNGYYVNCKGSGESADIGSGFNGDGYYINCEGYNDSSNGYKRYAFIGNGFYINCYANINRKNGSNEGYGFSGNGYYSNCKSKIFGGAYGFSGNGYYVNCESEVTTDGTVFIREALGFTGNGYYVNCKGIGISNGGSAFYNGGYGFYGQMKCFNCTGIGYTPSGDNACGFKNAWTSATTYVILNGCHAPKVIKGGYNADLSKVCGIDIGTSTNIGCHISGCTVSSEFGKKIISPTNETDKRYTGNNITTLAIGG